MSGNAVLVASRMLRDQILQGVAIATGEPLESLSIDDDCVTGLGKLCSLREAIAMCLSVGQPIHALGTFHGPKGKEVKHHLKSDRIFPDFTFGTHLADVEVDIDTGAVEVLRYVACHDVGRAINPQSVKGQISGAVAQGIGYALMERVVFDRGVNLSTGFFQYQIPTALDLPDVTCVVLESGDGVGPFGARGIGEPPIGPCAAAIASAIENAIGVRPVDLPILPEKVVAYLDGLQGQGKGDKEIVQ
jgi:CO/xanthine dehydrogenase Mo-binding subunit